MPFKATPFQNNDFFKKPFSEITPFFRILAHNGEINTLRGNINLMRAREGVMHSDLYGDGLDKLYPVVEDVRIFKNILLMTPFQNIDSFKFQGNTDSGCLDNVMEFLVKASGRTLPEAAMTMVPEAWEKDDVRV